MGYDSTFTLRGNRKAGAEKALLEEAKLKELKRGGMDYVQANGVLIVSWFDSKE